MTLEAIGALPVRSLAEDDAHLYLWVMNSNVPEGWWIAQAWGFRPLTMLTWCKTQPGVGQWFRNNTEHVLFCTRGAVLPRKAIPTSTWFVVKRGAHSAKPDSFYDLVESVSDGPYLEMFSRRNRFSWDTWGNECFEHVDLSGTEMDAA
jgi:N6-adenosine-specific RNA methylase IME4